MLGQIKSQVFQLTETIAELILQGPDITAFYILEARLTSLLSALPDPSSSSNLPNFPSPCLPKLPFSFPYNLMQSDQALPQRQSSSTELGGQFWRASSKNSRSQPLGELFILTQQILSSLQDWVPILSEFQLKCPLILRDNSLGLRDLIGGVELPLSSHNGNKTRQATQTTCDSYSEGQDKISDPTDQDLLQLLQKMARMRSQLHREIIEFKNTIKATKQDTSVDIEHEFFFSSLLQAKNDVKQEEGPAKSKNKLSERERCLRGRYSFEEGEPGESRSQQPVKVQQSGCAKCQIY